MSELYLYNCTTNNRKSRGTFYNSQPNLALLSVTVYFSLITTNHATFYNPTISNIYTSTIYFYSKNCVNFQMPILVNIYIIQNDVIYLHRVLNEYTTQNYLYTLDNGILWMKIKKTLCVQLLLVSNILWHLCKVLLLEIIKSVVYGMNDKKIFCICFSFNMTSYTLCFYNTQCLVYN